MIIKTTQSHGNSGCKITATSRASQNNSGKLRKCVVNYDYSCNSADNHELAAATLAERYGYSWVEQTGSHGKGVFYITTGEGE